MNDLDRDALERSMAMTQRDRSRKVQLTSMLEDRPWDEVATFAAFSMQNPC